MKNDGVENIITIIQRHAKKIPDQKAITFIDNNKHSSFSYSDIWEEICCISGYLKKQYNPGDRIIIALKPSENFTFAFLGCLAANIIPVPCYLPLSEFLLKKLVRIKNDCSASAIILDWDVYRTFKIAKNIIINRYMPSVLLNGFLEKIPFKLNNELLFFNILNINNLKKKNISIMILIAFQT